MKRTGRMRPTGRPGNHKAKAPTAPLAGGSVAGPAGGKGGPAAEPINVTGPPKPLGGLAMKMPTFKTLSTDRGSFRIK